MSTPSWACQRCERTNHRAGSRSAVCRPCYDALAAAGERWCEGCGAPRDARAFLGRRAHCRTCDARQQKNLTLAASGRPCVRCERRAAAPCSSICFGCHEGLQGQGQAWCERGRHVVAADAHDWHSRACRPCLAAVARQRRAASEDLRERNRAYCRAWRQRNAAYASEYGKLARKRRRMGL